jgi:hypothetical protein
MGYLQVNAMANEVIRKLTTGNYIQGTTGQINVHAEGNVYTISNGWDVGDNMLYSPSTATLALDPDIIVDSVTTTALTLGTGDGILSRTAGVVGTLAPAGVISTPTGALDDLVTQFNLLVDALRTQGIILPAL